MPEWIPASGSSEWNQTVWALVQLWKDVGHLGVIASGPIPWMSGSDWEHRPTTWHPHYPHLAQCRWLFSPDSGSLPKKSALVASATAALGTCPIALKSEDPVAEEQFLWILTPVFGAVAVQGRHPHTGQTGILVSFESEAIQQTWASLRLRILDPGLLASWERVIQSFPPQDPHHRVVAHYSTLLLLASRPAAAAAAQLPHGISIQPALPEQASVHDDSVRRWPLDSSSRPRSNQSVDQAVETQANTPSDSAQDPSSQSGSEVELLRALVHEINTPLSAILTRVRLALKQPDLAPRVQEHLQKIEQECLEQIERFKLFFQATETDPQRLQLEPTALVTILKEKLPRWQEQVRRRGSRLEIEIPTDLPNVVSDPQRLDTILSGMIDRVARISPPGSEIRIRVVSAGEQVKLQLQVMGQTEGSASKAIGQILVLQPETGAISLSIPVTQTLFRALGGHFTVRHRAQQGDVFTIYLPRHL